mgnify:FL=1
MHIGGNTACWITTKKLQQVRQWIKEASRHKCKQILQGKDDENCVKSLRFAGITIGSTGLSLLLRCALNGLEELNLINCEIGGNNIEAFSNNSNWPNLQKLNLAENSIGNENYEILSRKTSWKKLFLAQTPSLKSA